MPDAQPPLTDAAQDRLEALAVLWQCPVLAERTTVTVNARLRSSLGRAFPGRWRIELHKGLIEATPALVDEVVSHEAAHLVAYARHGYRIRPHGREWAALMRAAGHAPKARHDEVLPGLSRARSAARIEHRCPVCDVARVARRTMRAWRCRRCVEAGRSGRLTIVRLDRSPPPQGPDSEA